MMRHLTHAMRICLTATVGAALVLTSILALGHIGHEVSNAFADAYVPEDVDALPTVDAAIVLGTAPYGTRGQRYRTLSRRLQAAYELWSHGKAHYLIVSGNRIDDDYDEPLRMRNGLRDHLARALLIGHHLGLDVWGYAADGVTYTGVRGNIIGNLAVLRAYYDIAFDRRKRLGQKVTVGVDPPN